MTSCSRESSEKPSDHSGVSVQLRVWSATWAWVLVAVGLGKLTGWFEIQPVWLILLGIPTVIGIGRAGLVWLLYPSPQTLLAELGRTQTYRFRCLNVEVPQRWTLKRVKQYQQGILPRRWGTAGLVISVDFDWLMNTEINTVDAYKSYADEFVKNQLGGTIVRNELSEFCSIPCNDFEYVDRQGHRGRKLTMAYHGTEYGLLFTALDEQRCAEMRPVIDAFLARLTLRGPNFPARPVLGGRCRVGLPPTWTAVMAEDQRACWQGAPEPATLRLLWLADWRQGSVDWETLRVLNPERARRSGGSRGIHFWETGSTGRLYYDPGSQRDKPPIIWAAAGLQLASGGLVWAELEGPDVVFPGGLLGLAFFMEILVSIEDSAGLM